MQAIGHGPPALSLKSLAPPRAGAYPDQDLFQSLLQQRMVSRDYSGDGSSSKALNRTVSKSQLRQARPAASSSPLLTPSQSASRRPSHAVMQAVADQSQGSGKVKSFMADAHTPVEGQPSSSPASVKSPSPDLQANLRGKATRLAVGDVQVANQTPLPNTEMPPVLKGLIAFLNQSPGQALKVPTDRLPEVESFLLQAGLPPEQVERLINSPNFQEQGLTAQNVQAAWQNAVKNSLQQAVTTDGNQVAASLGQKIGQAAGQKAVENAAQLVSLQNLVNKPDYQQMWQGLTLPKQDLAVLRTELQKLGVPPEALADLNEQNFPQGIPLTQVWKYIQQAPKSPAASAATLGTSDPAKGNMAAKMNMAPNSPLLPAGGKDLGTWRQLLMDAGMAPELAQTLTSGPNPTTREELRAGLAQVAPPTSPQEQAVPKPLYLPENVRVRQVPWLQQAAGGQGQGGTGLEQGGAGLGQGGGNGNLTQNFAFSSKSQEANITLPATANVTENLNNFLALLTGDSQMKTDQAETTGVSGNQPPAVNAFLTPEAKEAIWAQVQSGVLGNLRPGENQITLTLNPPDLGKLHLTLNIKDGNVEVTAVTSHAAVAEAATTGVQQLAQALGQQGLILTHFNFHHQDEAPQGQAQLAFSQNQGGDQKQTGQKEPGDKWERPATPKRRANGNIDCFA